MTSQEIQRAAEHIERERDQLRARLDCAADAGAELAAEVYRYIEDPGLVGMVVLHEAYHRFMGLHAGNFTASRHAAEA